MDGRMGGLIFYSSGSGNTARFVDRLGLPALRIPVDAGAALPEPGGPYVLVCPTYADGQGRGAVPAQVIRFLNDPARRALIRGVIGTGNRNFGETYCLGGKMVAQKCAVPLLYCFELAGNDRDIDRVREGLDHFWRTECLTP